MDIQLYTQYIWWLWTSSVYILIKFLSGEKAVIISVPTGTYKLEHLASEFEARYEKHNIELSLKSNENTLKTTLRSNWSIDFRVENKNTVRDLLDFKPDLYDANKDHEAQDIVNIISINSIEIECSIVTGS